MNTEAASGPFQEKTHTSTIAAGLATQRITDGANDTGVTVSDQSGWAERKTSPKPTAPIQVGDYDIVREIAHGGMGIVYEAHDRQLQRMVALKMIRGGVFARAEDVERFKREAQAIARLQHPHIIQVLDFGWHQSLPYFTMKLARGSLSKRLAAFADRPRDSVVLMEKVARAIHHAHENQILHRDLKPGNILLDEADEPLVSDFGLVKLLDDALELTRTGAVLGTPSYMAPEQLRPRESDRVGPHSDVWSMGVILFELMAGRKPFTGETHEAVSTQILNSDPPSIRSLRPQVDRDLEKVVGKCLEKDPALRYPTAADLANELARWLRGEPVQARPVSWVRRTVRRVRRHAFACAAALLAVAAVSAALVLREVNDPERPLRQLKARLARGESVTVIGDVGPPAWSRGVLGDAFLSADATKPFYISAGPDLCLLEVVPAGTLPAYRLSALVKHEESTDQGKAGLYVGHEAIADNRDLLHHFFAPYYFDDHHFKSDGKSGLNLRIFWTSAENPLWQGPYLASHRFVPAFKPPERLGKADWRQLALEVHPERIDCWWDGKRVAMAPADKTRDASRQMTEGMPFLAPRLGPDGGIGLCAQASTVHYKQLIVQPLAP